jgi:DNA-binding NarL/FixJ family response regulator
MPTKPSADLTPRRAPAPTLHCWLERGSFANPKELLEVTISTNYAAPSERRVDSASSARVDAALRAVQAEERTQLQMEAMRVDARATVQMSLALLWRELSLGLCRIEDGFFSETRCFLLTIRSEGPAQPLQGRRREILEAVLCGVGQKNIAVELALAPSTIALNARVALDGLGMSSRPSRAHPLLMLAAKAARCQDGRVQGALSFLEHEGKSVRVISLPRPDLRLSEALPPAELSVVKSLIEGACYEEIAQMRGTSTRTIANQITTVFRRLKVSGRSELLSQLFAEQGFSFEQ